MTITILDSSPKLLAKRIRMTSDGIDIVTYDKAYKFHYSDIDADNIDDLYMILRDIAQCPTICIIRGQLIEGIDTSKPILRRKNGQAASFQEHPLGVQWMMCDFDALPTPEHLHTQQEYLDYLISLLPGYMQNASYVYQWSSKAGLDDWKTLRCHLWFWMQEPRTDSQMMAWASGFDGVIDEAVFRTVQVHYTADPIFEGVANPITDRVGIVKRANDSVAIPLVPPKSTISTSSNYIPQAQPSGLLTKFDVKLQNIGPRYHLPITECVGSWCALTGPGCDWHRFKERVRDRIMQAPGEGAGGKKFYMSEEYLDGLIRCCHFSHKAVGPSRLPETKQERFRYKMTNGHQI